MFLVPGTSCNGLIARALVFKILVISKMIGNRLGRQVKLSNLRRNMKMKNVNHVFSEIVLAGKYKKSP